MGFVTYKKIYAGVSQQFIFPKPLSRRRRCLRDFSVLFLRVVNRLKKMFSDGQDVKYDRDITPVHILSRYKQSRSDAGSAEKIRINEEREGEKFSHQRRRTSR